MAYYLYMLRCENGSIYTGTAKDYLKRYEEHLNGKGAKYTKAHKVIKIERVFLCISRSIACSLESEIKKYEKIKFAEDIYLNSSKESTSIIVEYLINLVKRDKNLKEKLEYKKMLRYPVNIKLLLINLIMSI